MGLEANQVITGITRIENTKTAGTTYIFEKLGETELTLTPEESAALNSMKAKAVGGKAIPVSFAAELLQNLASLDGITEERAQRLAESIAIDGMITGKSN